MVRNDIESLSFTKTRTSKSELSLESPRDLDPKTTICIISDTVEKTAVSLSKIIFSYGLNILITFNCIQGKDIDQDPEYQHTPLGETAL